MLRKNGSAAACLKDEAGLGMTQREFFCALEPRLVLSGAVGDLAPSGLINPNLPFRNAAIVDSIAGFDHQGAVVYELGDDHLWRITHIEDKAADDRERGGEGIDEGEVIEDVVSFVDPKDGVSYTAALTENGLILGKNTGNGQWTFRNLTKELDGELISPLFGGLHVMIDANQHVSLVGLNTAHELVRYFQAGAKNKYGTWIWASQNITATELLANGQSMPEWNDDLVTYATPWGGLNVVGLDADGNIQAVWWAPTMDHWMSTDLTSAYGAEPLSGGLTVYQTPWGGVNIAGVDDQGGLRAAWWVPGFGGDWKHTDLSTEIGGPRVDPGSVSSFVSAWGGINIVGRDSETGEIKAYWWSPERTENGWAVTSLSGTVGAAAPTFYGELEGKAAKDGSLNVFGTDENGDLSRLYWYPGFGGQWMAENLATVATLV